MISIENLNFRSSTCHAELMYDKLDDYEASQMPVIFSTSGSGNSKQRLVAGVEAEYSGDKKGHPYA